MVNMPEQTFWQLQGWQRLLGTMAAVALCVMTPVATAAIPVQKTFESPEAGVNALVGAVRANDLDMLRAILGPYSRRLISSGAAGAHAQNREAFLKAYGDANRIALEGDT